MHTKCTGVSLGACAVFVKVDYAQPSCLNRLASSISRQNSTQRFVGSFAYSSGLVRQPGVSHHPIAHTLSMDSSTSFQSTLAPTSHLEHVDTRFGIPHNALLGPVSNSTTLFDAWATLAGGSLAGFHQSPCLGHPLNLPGSCATPGLGVPTVHVESARSFCPARLKDFPMQGALQQKWSLVPPASCQALCVLSIRPGTWSAP